jgi:periplasmic protein TonB
MGRFFSTTSNRRALFVLLAIIVIALLGGSAFLYARARSEAPATADAAVAAEVVDPASSSSSSGTDILLGLARTAIKEDRLVAPAGANAYEFYLSVLQLDPNNKVALDALRETFPFASATIDRTISQKELDEAQREISLLREFDSTNYTLVILGAKLHAERQIATREDERIADSMQKAAGQAPAAK